MASPGIETFCNLPERSEHMSKLVARWVRDPSDLASVAIRELQNGIWSDAAGIEVLVSWRRLKCARVSSERNFLMFGAGAHQCAGQRYALNHLVLFIALFASAVDFRRDKTEGCDELAYVPTIVPRDCCAVYLRQRCAKFP